MKYVKVCPAQIQYDNGPPSWRGNCASAWLVSMVSQKHAIQFKQITLKRKDTSTSHIKKEEMFRISIPDSVKDFRIMPIIASHSVLLNAVSPVNAFLNENS